MKNIIVVQPHSNKSKSLPLNVVATHVPNNNQFKLNAKNNYSVVGEGTFVAPEAMVKPYNTEEKHANLADGKSWEKISAVVKSTKYVNHTTQQT